MKALLQNEKIKGLISIVAAIVMYYTPDHIDMIIEALLAAMGIQKLVIGKDDED